MRSQRPGIGDAPTQWELAGWTREPRNGREWRQLKDGLPEPRVQRSVKPCRSCKGRNFTINSRDGKKYRQCIDCRSAAVRRHHARHPERYKKWSNNFMAKVRAEDLSPNEDGRPRVITTRLLHHRSSEIADRVMNGERFIVERFGVVAYALIPPEDMMMLARHRRDLTYP